MDAIPETDRTTLRRLPKRGYHDRATIDAVLDAGFLCHVGFVVDGLPYVIPTSYTRDGNRLLIHGSAASRMLRTLKDGVDVCVTVTLLDGLVLARSVFHHSMNYRSVVVFGRATPVEDQVEKTNAMRLFTEHVIAGRWNDARRPTENELKATLVLALPIEEASAKIRTGPPLDEEEDYGLPVWAGVVPLGLRRGELIPDSQGIPIPGYLTDFRI